VRAEVSKIPDIVAALSTGNLKWDDCVKEHGLFQTAKDDAGADE
jgi:hypothetical protein